MQTILDKLSDPIDISIPLSGKRDNPIAWYIDQPRIEPVKMDDFVGSVASGKSSTNFNNIFFNPHAHGTHTECLGHITEDFFSVNQSLKKYFFSCLLISIKPDKIKEDGVITAGLLKEKIKKNRAEAIVIRTLPNDAEKTRRNYSHTNPPYLTEEAATLLRNMGFEHLLIDLPSVDKEKDEGKLLAHKAFWNVKDVHHVNEDARFYSTITEFVYVPDDVEDGEYLLNLQIASFENDAAPSKPVLYKLT